MNTRDKDWWTAQAGEYVLGTLDNTEWAEFAALLQTNKDLQRMVVEWEQIFQPLADSLTPVEPAAHVWGGVRQRLSTAGSNVVQFHELKTMAKDLARSVDRWRGYAGLATAASILLATFVWIGQLGTTKPVEPTTSISIAEFDAISIVRDENDEPLWVVDSALAEGVVRVTAVAPPELDESKTYELWVVKPDNTGVVSMGPIPLDENKSLILDVITVADKPVAFAVSLEPAGGSQLDGPSGPVLYQGSFRTLDVIGSEL